MIDVPGGGQRSGRDSAIDVIKGMALLAIYSDHIPLNPVSRYTLTGVCFFDFSEVFVYFSGLVYGWRSSQRPFRETLKRSLIRSVQLVVCVVGVSLLIHSLWNVHQSWSLTNCGAMHAIAGQVRAVEVREIVSLRSIAGSIRILALYAILIAGAPFVMQALRRHAGWVLAVSLALYAAALWTNRVQLPEPWAAAIYYQPAAWQLLFVVALMRGFREGSWHTSRAARMTLAAALFVFAALVTLRISGTWPDETWWADKSRLAPLRLMHLASAIVIIDWLRGTASGFARPGPVLELLRACGRHSLIVFCVGACLSVPATCLSLCDPRPVMAWAVNVTGWMICGCVGLVADTLRQRWKAGSTRMRL